MRDIKLIALFAILIATLPFLTNSGVILNFVVMALYASLLAQSWNILGGYSGQFSFGNAVFFGTGAYIQAIAQMQFSMNAWNALLLALCASACVGLFVGSVSFRYGLKGSYFALVTLAMAEIFRILSLSVNFTGGGVGLMLPLNSSFAGMQFVQKSGYVWLILSLVCAALLITSFIKHSKLGAYMQAVRDNEDAAKALGINPFSVKLVAISLCSVVMGAGGAIYVQLFQYIDPSIAYGPQSSVEALVAAIVGGVGTLWGPIIGATALLLMSELTRNLFGQIPGINMVIYGFVLVFIVLFAPAGLTGLGVSVRTLFSRPNNTNNTKDVDGADDLKGRDAENAENAEKGTDRASLKKSTNSPKFSDTQVTPVTSPTIGGK